MGLDRDFLSLLTASVGYESALEKDTWGNTGYTPLEPVACFIDAANATYGRAVPESFKESQQTATATIYLDAAGAKIGDRITFDSKQHWVTDLVTFKDEFGDDLLQVVTVTDQKKG